MANKMTYKDVPCISVIIPTYNRRPLLQRAMNSALEQTENDIEVIIADDGSTDGTKELVYAIQDSRIRYLALPHQGACAARNAGLDAARGQYIAFLDSDDVWHPNKLHIQKNQLEASDADIVFCALLRHGIGNSYTERCPAGNVPEGWVNSNHLLRGNIVSTQTLFGRARCMKQIRFDTRFPRMQDWEYAIQLTKRFRLRYFNHILVDVYLQEDSISNQPELALKAVRLLYATHHEDYEASISNMRSMMEAFHHYAMQCQHCCIKDYIHMITAMKKREKILRLFYDAVRFAYKERFTFASRSRKVLL